ncbi:MAG: PGF-CTERM sorting domain-containing protein, partial [Candidatus Methanoperedens sp.]|nr:PGF-CTERM sorting domain-containing protein [Candidatus Methanoperedens sp.]
TAIDAKAEAASIVPQSATPGVTVAAVVATTAAAAATAPPSSAPQDRGYQEASKQAASASTTSKAEPGFELVFAIIGLIMVKYLALGRRR